MPFDPSTHPESIAQAPLRVAVTVCVVSFLGMLTSERGSRGDDEVVRLFESEVRPLLHKHCLKCHGALKQSGGLRLDSHEALQAGGDSGPAVVPGQSAASRLIKAVRRTGDLAMPPEEKLSARQVAALATWIDHGAVWPQPPDVRASLSEKPAGPHWAFQPVQEPTVPDVAETSWVRTPVDAFVLARLRQAGMRPSPPADRRTLIRRLSYTLTGLPPSAADVDAFVHDPDPRAFEQLVDRLLDSPHYGEQWARHWLDVARYSDTKGYVYAREERFWVHTWAYRDWVVNALNHDLPYNRFLLLQLAADQVDDRTPGDLAAMGFLTLGRRFLGVKHDIIDDRIDVVCRGTMGLTVSCARCHDHKYDPIPTADYYSLYGIFDSCAEQIVAIGDGSEGDEAYRSELQSRQDKLRTRLAECREESAARVRSRIADYLHAQTELDKYPPDAFGQIFEKSDLLPAFVRRWERFLHEADRRRDPVFIAWHAYAGLPGESFAEQSQGITSRLHQDEAGAVNSRVLEAFASPPKTFDEVIDRYAALFTDVDAQWKASLSAARESDAPTPESLPDAAAEQLRRVLYGPQAPCEVPHEPIVHTEMFFDTRGACEELWKLQGEVDRWIINAPVLDTYALTLIDRPVPVRPRVHRRGNPLDAGEEIPRRFLSLLAGEDAPPFQRGSGRYELAQAIIDPANPLTARVMVNRVWAHHFGRGLVPTTSDFGLRAEDPSHPELLDWLAARFIAEGWSLKQLHRRILLSSTFRQSSAGPADQALRQQALVKDSDNRLLWRMNPRRLTFEQIRDSMLAVSGALESHLGGKPVRLFQQPFPKRRTLYGLVDRQYLPGTLRMFDFANPDLHIPRRSETTVPQQALFFLNHPLVLAGVRSLVESLDVEEPPRATARELFRKVLQREPTNEELLEAMELVNSAEETEMPRPPATAADWQYGYGTMDELAGRVTQFQSLPHFTGSAWQGGPDWPDKSLGWVQLTAEGGHPGNDRAHAAIRRWIAPRRMTVTIESQLIHKPQPGDGIRAFVVSSRAGILHFAKAHQQTIDMTFSSIAIEPGETLDFVVDIGDVLNSDQYLWHVMLRETPANEDEERLRWDSARDFTQESVSRLSRWEQLAHVLLCANEFLFID